MTGLSYESIRFLGFVTQGGSAMPRGTNEEHT
jgi:hypothetical protein